MENKQQQITIKSLVKMFLLLEIIELLDQYNKLGADGEIILKKILKKWRAAMRERYPQTEIMALLQTIKILEQYKGTYIEKETAKDLINKIRELLDKKSKVK